jgi:phage tail-like protein
MSNRYPPVSFFFEVVFQDEGLDKEPVETRFQSVSGLNVEFQSESLKEGGENRFEHQLPTRTKFSPLVLKRGLVDNSNLIAWFTDALFNFDIRPMNVQVRLKGYQNVSANEPGTELKNLVVWDLVNAWPKKWNLSDLDAEQSALAIETLELNYQYFTVKYA